MAGREQCRGGWPFINVLPAPRLCALPGNTDCCTGPLCEVPIM
ncbi:unnamed protein product [Staurois parvus]|uniref:Uncharacterized protein n=1 Tax=Staurois parvus TaxID=386267 RepID=A0ABN9DP81_9NEOB|nr:unnamed protein product [Staurois parvus]